MTNLQVQIITKYKVFFDFNYKLRRLVNELINCKFPKAQKKDIFAIYAIGKAFKTHTVIIMDCESGYGEDGSILARSLFELLIILKYILQDDSNGRIDRYLDYDWIIRHKTYEYAKTKDYLIELMDQRELTSQQGQDTREEVEKNAFIVQQKYGYNRFGWANKTIKQMAEEVKLGDAYKTIYSLQSQFVHNAVRTMNDYLKATQTGFSVNTGPSENWIEETLISSFDFLFSIAKEYDKFRNLGYKNKLEKIYKEFKKEVDLLEDKN